jgi:hypothetical protein
MKSLEGLHTIAGVSINQFTRDSEDEMKAEMIW